MKRPEVILDALYTIPETCKAMGIDRRTLRRYTQAGSITCHIRACDGRIVYYGRDIALCYNTVI